MSGVVTGHLQIDRPLLWSEPSPDFDATGTVLRAQPGRILALEGPTGLGLTRVGLSLLAPIAERVPVVAVDVRGWLCPLAAWEVGVRADRFLVVRCDDRLAWPRVVSALLDGIQGVYAEVPPRTPDGLLRRIAALARTRDAALVLRPIEGSLPSGLAYLRARAVEVTWKGPEDGHGRLEGRRIRMEISGKGASGMVREIEVEDDGANVVRVVSELATPATRRAAG